MLTVSFLRSKWQIGPSNLASIFVLRTQKVDSKHTSISALLMIIREHTDESVLSYLRHIRADRQPAMLRAPVQNNMLYTRPKNAQSRGAIASRHSASPSDHASVSRTQFAVLESTGATASLHTAPMQACTAATA